MNHALCQILDWDSRFFGFKIARIKDSSIDQKSWQEISEFCQSEKVKCLYFTTSPADRQSLEIIRSTQFDLVDIRITLNCDLSNPHDIQKSDDVTIRQAVVSDIPYLESIARENHKDSRFFFDPGFPKNLCRDLYAAWIRKNILDENVTVYVPEIQERAEGYLSCTHSENSRKGNIELVGLAKPFQRQGIGSMLIQHALTFLSGQKIEQVDVVTQGRNISAQQFYQKHGFKTSLIELTYHKWLL